MKTATRYFLLLCLSGTALSLPAQAQELPDAVQAILDNIENQTGTAPTYETMEVSDDSVTLANLSVTAASGQASYKAERAEFSDIKEAGDGLYEIGESTFTGMKLDMNAPEMAMTVSIPEISGEGWFVAEADDNATAAEKVRASMTIARKFSAGKMDVSVMGQSITVEGYEQTWDGDPATGSGTSSMSLKGITIPESTIAMLDTMGMLKQLGYSNLSFDITGQGKMDMSDTAMGMDMDIAISGKDMGTFKFGASAAGIPLEAYAGFMAAGEAGKEPDFNAMMPQLMGVSLSRMSLRFEDASITKRVLPMIAAMQGMDEATLIASAGPIMQMGLMQIGNQAFADQTVAAVNAFLQSPQSLTVAANPGNPVTVGDLMGLDPAAPGAAIDKLGVTVSANN